MELHTIHPGPFELEAVGEEGSAFRGFCAVGAAGRVFGGHLVAQSLLAAAATVPDDRPVHSLHAYFERAGDHRAGIRYDVHARRDGGAYSLRGVVAAQEGTDLLVMNASFKRPEYGDTRHARMPLVPGPDAVAVIPETTERFWAAIAPDSLLREAIDVVPAHEHPHVPTATADTGECVRYLWMRLRVPLPQVPGAQYAGLSLLSDLSMARTAALGHLGEGAGEPADLTFTTSLDHALWFHRPCRADDWLLVVQTSRTSGDGRGFSTAEFWSADGALVASAAQELVLRAARS